jgi:F0F1-type ATP synthase assembly protein I
LCKKRSKRSKHCESVPVINRKQPADVDGSIGGEEQQSAPLPPSSHSADSATRKESAMKAMAPFLNLGMELFASVAGFGLVGWFIDSKAGTEPTWLLVFLLLGAIGGMYNFIKTVMNVSKAPTKPSSTVSER